MVLRWFSTRQSGTSIGAVAALAGDPPQLDDALGPVRLLAGEPAVWSLTSW